MIEVFLGVLAWLSGSYLYRVLRDRLRLIDQVDETKMLARLEHAENQANAALHAVDPAFAIEMGYDPSVYKSPTGRTFKTVSEKKEGGLVQGSFQQALAPGLRQQLGALQAPPIAGGSGWIARRRSRPSPAAVQPTGPAYATGCAGRHALSAGHDGSATDAQP